MISYHTKEELQDMYLTVLEEKKKSGYRHYPNDSDDRIMELYHDDVVEAILGESDESFHDSILEQIETLWD